MAVGTRRPDLEDLRRAAERIRPFIHRTPVMTCSAIDTMIGASLFFKCENLQKVGAFKFRGATNAVQSLTDEEAPRGVATHSSGNHAAALALAARNRGIPVHVVMPENSPEIKKRAVASYGANIVYCPPTLEARESHLREVVARTGATVVHPYDDDRIIAGQGTAGLELVEDVPDLDGVIAPVGGGGLLAGTSIAVKSLSPAALVWGAEPSLADDAARSLHAGAIVPSTYPDTIADGLKTSLGDRNFEILQRNVDDILTVSEDGIRGAMRILWERMKLVVEPSGAVPLGALLENGARARDKRVGVILSGGNVDLDRFRWSDL